MAINFTRQQSKKTVEALEKILATFCTEHGIGYQLASASYHPDGAQLTLKIVLSAPTASGEILDADALAFKRHAERFRLKAEWLFEVITIRGGTYRVVGLRPRAHVRPVVISDHAGRKLVVEAEFVRRQLEKKTEKAI